MLQKIRLLKLNKSMGDKTPDNGDKPKKPRSSKKAAVTPPAPAPKQPPVPIPDAVIEQLIKDAIRIRIVERKNRQVDDELDAMVATCQEFMKSFVILGYNLEGEQVPPIVVCSSQQEADAIGNYLQKFLQHIARNDGQIE
jgi:hypothetical protein